MTDDEPLDLAPYRRAKVLIPQFPMELVGRHAELTRRELDLSGAEVFGDLVEMLGPDARPWASEAIQGIDDFIRRRTHADDWLLAIGSPTLIAASAGALCARHGRLGLLQWRGRRARYTATRITFGRDGTRVERVYEEDQG